MLISNSGLTSLFDSVYVVVLRWVNFSEKCLHEHELQLSDYNVRGSIISNTNRDTAPFRKYFVKIYINIIYKFC